MPRVKATSPAAPRTTHAEDRAVPEATASAAAPRRAPGGKAIRTASAARDGATTSRNFPFTTSREVGPSRVPVVPWLLAAARHQRGRRDRDGSSAFGRWASTDRNVRPPWNPATHRCFGSPATRRFRKGCWKPGEPHGRLQGATDLHCARGANRRSREKRQGRNRTRAWHARAEGARKVVTPARRRGPSGPRQRDGEGATDSGPPQARPGPSACFGKHPVRSGTAGHWEWTRAADVDGGAIFEITHERSPARLPATSPGRPRGVDDALLGDEQGSEASAPGTRRIARGRQPADTGFGP